MRSILGGEEVVGEELVILRGDGTWGRVRVSSSPVYDNQLHIIAGVIAFYASSKRYAEEACLKAEERYRVVVETASDAIVVPGKEAEYSSLTTLSRFIEGGVATSQSASGSRKILERFITGTS